MNARDLGFDRSLIGAYGHDDRVCAYAALAALFEAEAPAYTAVCVLADKEETGSDGVSGMQSAAFDTFISDLCDSQNVPLKACFENSCCLSADVTAAYDPKYPEVYEKRNSARLNYGVGLCKYTGSRGKSGSSDASAETDLPISAGFLTMRALPGRWLNWARWTRVAAEPSPNIWQTATLTHWTRALPFYLCTHRLKWSRSLTAI